MGRLIWFNSILGAIFGAVALVSLCVKLFHVGLAPITTDIVEAYRAVVHPVMNFLLSWTNWIWPNWHIPAWLKDLYTLSFLGSFGIWKGVAIAEDVTGNRATPTDPTTRIIDSIVRNIIITISGFIMGALFLGLLAFPYAIGMLALILREDWRNGSRELKYFAAIAAVTYGSVLGGAIFFALNYEELHNWKWSSIFG